MVPAKNCNMDQWKLEQELVGIHHNHFDRDKDLIRNLYLEIYEDSRRMPKLTEIEISIAEYNYDVCYRVSAIEFDTIYRKDALQTMQDLFSCSQRDLGKYINTEEVIASEMDYLASEMFNAMCAGDTDECIRQALDILEVVYEDDSESGPLATDIYNSRDTHMVVTNDAQIVMFPDIHAEEYGYSDTSIFDGYEDVCGFIIQKRTKDRSRVKSIKDGGELYASKQSLCATGCRE